MTIRILYLTREAFPSFRPDISTLFGKSLPAVGVCSDLVALAATDAVDAASWPAGEVFTRRATSKVGRLVARLRLAFDIFKLAGTKQYAAIQVRDRVFGALIGLIAARWHGLPFIYWMSLPFPEAWQDMGKSTAITIVSAGRQLRWRVQGSIAGWILYTLVLPRASHVFVQSDAMLSMLATRGINPKQMTPVPMGVDTACDLEQVIPSTDVRLEGKRVIVYLGALERIRHPEIMVTAMTMVTQRCPDAVLALVGDSQTAGERQWLQGEIDRLGLGASVFITGWLQPNVARGYLRSASVGLSPFPRSRVLEVASPTKVCEYLAYGVPVVANDQPDQAYLLRETAGGLCVPLTPEGFAAGILELLADPPRAKQMAFNGKRVIAALRGYEVIGTRLGTRYKELLPERVNP